MRPWLRRLITRALAVTPAALTIYFAGEKATLGLLLLSQAVLSMQLPFAIIPLIHFTSDRGRMGSFRNRAWVKTLAWITAVIIIGLNAWLLVDTIGEWLASAGHWKTLVWLITVPAGIGLALLLAWITVEPWISRRRMSGAPVELPEMAGAATEQTPVYRRILVPLDHTGLDRLAVAHAAAMARLHGARLYLLHVEEDVTSQLFGPESSTAEVEAGEQYLDRIAQSLRDQEISVETSISHSSSPKKEIVRYAREIHPDLVIMGAHGHGGIKDLIFGNTINPVRHDLDVPMLIVRPGKQ
jgi:manganese transport protein